jgi:hypothetical protein
VMVEICLWLVGIFVVLDILAGLFLLVCGR